MASDAEARMAKMAIIEKKLASLRPCTAYHEAGHAVAFLAFGCPVKSATIVRAALASGEVLARPVGGTIPVSHLVTGLMAGRVAQEKYLVLTGVPLDEDMLGHLTAGAVDDVAQIHGYLEGRDLQPDIIISVATSKAAELLEANWPAVERVAAELLAHGTLTGAQIEAIYQAEAHANAA